MSDKQFQEAKSNLAFSQSLRDQLMAAQAPQAPEMPQGEEFVEETVDEAPEQETPATEAPEPEKEESGLVDMFESFMEETRGMFEKLFKMEKEEEKNGAEVEMPKMEAVEEHERLVEVLESPSNEDDKVEAEKQEEELEEYKK